MAMAVSKYRTWAIALSPFFLIMLGCGIYFGPQIHVYLELRHIMGPRSLGEVPRPLADTTMSKSPGTTLLYFGYRFEVPWVGIRKETNEGRWVTVFFKAGQEVSFFNPNYFQDDTLLGDAKWQPEVFREAFGTHPAGSKYAHLKAALSMSPSRLSPFRSRRHFAQDRVYLETKGLWLEHSGLIDIFTVQTTAYKGFETSGISHDGGAAVTLFDAADREFHIAVSRASSSAPKLTQAEINRIIQTFGPAASTATPGDELNMPQRTAARKGARKWSQ